MSGKRRKQTATPFFHVMTQGINKSYIFNDEDEIKKYLSLMYKLNQKYNIEIMVYCIMHNHAHLLIKTQKIENLSEFMMNLNSQYAKFYNKKHNRVGYVFRDRFKSQDICSEKQLYNCIRYIFNNPVKAKICCSPEQYPYSNYKTTNYKVSMLESSSNSKTYDNGFIDIDEEKKNVEYIIKDFIKNDTFENFIDNKENLKTLVKHLNEDCGISFRKIEKEIGINRQKLSYLLK